jgi:hypothetical protein
MLKKKHGKRDPKTVIDVDRWSKAHTLQKIIKTNFCGMVSLFQSSLDQDL